MGDYSSLDKQPLSFIFRTREGSTGVFQVTSNSNRKSGVKIRYKLVREGKGPHGDLRFGRSRTFLNLDKGEILAMPQDFGDWSEMEKLFWIGKSGGHIEAAHFADSLRITIYQSNHVVFEKVGDWNWDWNEMVRPTLDRRTKSILESSPAPGSLQSSLQVPRIEFTGDLCFFDDEGHFRITEDRT